MTAPVWLRAVGVVGIAWNAIGVVSYLGHVGLMQPMGPPPDTQMPAIVTATYALGVFGAVLGCLGLILLKRWANPVMWISFIGLVIDWGWAFSATSRASVSLGVTVLTVALALALLARFAARRGWLT